MKRWCHALLGALLGCAVLGWGPSALAQLHANALPILGTSMPFDSNWAECAVRIENDSSRPAKGFVELQSGQPQIDDNSLVSRAAFTVAAESAVTVRLPTHGFRSTGGSLELRLLSEDGHVLSTTPVPLSGGTVPFLVDVSEPPRLAASLVNVPISISHDPTRGALARSSRTGMTPIATGSPRLDPATGDPVLPDRAAGYASATVVVMRSDQLTRLQGLALDALGNYVLAGGSLALVISRPEDLRHPSVVALTGAEVSPTTVDRALRTLPTERVEEQGNEPGARPRRPSAPTLVWPSSEVSSTLTGYRGGNLHPSIFGASATYGLGEVHLLAFDPTQAPGVDDPWVRSRMAELVRHAWERRSFLINPHGQAQSERHGINEVRKQLDPNEASRWGIIVAALVLCAYAVVAGPINFSRAAKRGRPLRALWHLPLWSAGTFALLVLIGITAKGWTGKARHLTLIEAGAGMSKGAACRFRGFFTSGSRSLTVEATDISSVLDAASDPRAGASRSLLVDRDGLRLVGLSTLPWETVVVREDSFTSLGGGVSLVQGDGELIVVNRLARDLRAVLVVPPGSGPTRTAYFFARIRDGERKRVTEGTALSWTPSTSYYGGRELNIHAIADRLDAHGADLSAAWNAIDAASSRGDWWPEDVPVLLAQVDGGEGKVRDSGLRIDRDRVLIRVVGYGGLP